MGTALGIVLACSLVATQSHVTVAVGGRAVQPGEVVVLTVHTAEPAARVGVHVFDRDVTAFRADDPLTWTALVGIDLDVKPGAYRAEVEVHLNGSGSGTVRQSATLNVSARRFSTLRLRVDPGFVNPPDAETTRILDEAARLAHLWTMDTERHWSGPFMSPVTVKPVGRFGARSVFNGQPRQPHGGDDYPGPVGTPIVSPAGGKVVLAENLYFTGNTVVVDHGLGVLSLFAHLSKIGVAKGDTVEGGQRIGLIGATGRVTGPHLHWAVRLGGARVDPASLLAAVGKTPATDSASAPSGAR